VDHAQGPPNDWLFVPCPTPLRTVAWVTAGERCTSLLHLRAALKKRRSLWLYYEDVAFTRTHVVAVQLAR
jgi:hypothetical protein